MILKASKVQFDLVSAHPKANGFYGARFPLGIVTRLIHVCSKHLICKNIKQKCISEMYNLGRNEKSTNFVLGVPGLAQTFSTLYRGKSDVKLTFNHSRVKKLRSTLGIVLQTRFFEIEIRYFCSDHKLEQ